MARPMRIRDELRSGSSWTVSAPLGESGARHAVRSLATEAVAVVLAIRGPAGDGAGSQEEPT